MIVLGICDSHEAHACVVRDGVLVAAMSEERLSRVKADMGYPRRSIDAVLRLAGIAPNDIDVVAIAGQRDTAFQRLYKISALFKVQDWIRQCDGYWRPLLMEGKSLTEWDDFELFRHLRGPDITDDIYFPFVERARAADYQDRFAIFNDIRHEAVRLHLGVSADRIRQFRHEDCHKAYGLHSSPLKLDRAVVLTIEGGGDDSSATYSTFRDGTITEHWRSNAVNLGRLYRYVTLILGMQPLQHEYKVMGLAPYGSEHHGRRSRAFFDSLSTVSGTHILDNGRVRDLYFSVRDALEGERFDGIAWGLQTHVEQLLCQWVQNCIDDSGIDNVILSGGVGQNIKACKAVMETTSAKHVWAGPICGDGSLGVGAAWLAHRELAPDVAIRGYDSIYLGTEHEPIAVREAIGRRGLSDRFTVVDRPDADMVASWLERGHICARFSGRMEFGQRALGNRSILADPRRWDSVERVNQKIKYRDFWMPFTPSMTAKQAEQMIDNPKGLYSPYMTMSFDLKPEFRDKIPAATHPADKSVRPQVLRRHDNPGYYDLISAFGKRTGLACVMNTSFNLHGDAIVESPDDAIDTFERSELDILVFDDVAIARRALNEGT